MQTPAAAIDRHCSQITPGYRGREAQRSPPFLAGTGFSSDFRGSSQFPAQLDPLEMKALIRFLA